MHCLIDAINVSNGNGEPNTIRLDAGTYTLTAPDNVLPPPFAFGNGFPLITGRMTISGAATDQTIIERANYRTDLFTNAFRFFNVAASGELGIERLTLRGGNTGMNSLAGNAGAILSHGALSISDAAVTDNFAALAGAVQIANGTFTLRDSRVERNNVDLGGDIVSIGNRLGATGPFGPVSATIERTTFADNRMLDGGVISSSSTASTRITDTTVAGTRIGNGDGGAIIAFGRVFISNATIIDNSGGHGHLVFIGGADTLVVNSTIVNNLGSVTGLFQVQNSIFAGNRGELPGECSGGLVSLGHNLIGDPRGCASVLPSDLTGDAGLGSFVTGGRPGGGHVPLLADSRAIDAADPGGCAATDQRQLARPVDGNGDGVRGCDIGAVEFYPLVNDLLQLVAVRAAFQPPPSVPDLINPSAAGGSFQIDSTFINLAPTNICHVAFAVATLGANSATVTMLAPDAHPLGGQGVTIPATSLGAPADLAVQGQEFYHFDIGVSRPEAITFLVNVLGEPFAGGCTP